MEIAVDNFRSFKETELFCNTLLNVFIGKNSSGKSSFLRLFPLLKQTLDNDTSEPFLWYSPDYVDFGDYNNVLGSDANKPISFHFSFDLDPFYFYNSNRMHNLNFSHSSLDLSAKNYFEIVNKLPSWEVFLAIDVKEDFISSIYMEVQDIEFEIKFDQYDLLSFQINEEVFFDSDQHRNKKIKITPYKRNLLSLIRTSLRSSSNFILDNNDDTSIKNNNSISEGNFSDLFIRPEIVNLWNDIFNNNNEEEDFDDIQSLVIGDFLHLNHNYLREKFSLLANEYEIDYKDDFDLEYSYELDRLANLFISYYANDFLLAIDKYFEDYFSRVKYIAPLRAPVQRYYRLQGISLSDVDPSGHNIPMIIANMNDKEIRGFTAFTKENFGFHIIREMTPGHVSILIGINDETPRNIIDLGFGYSQIIPIIVELWHSVSRTNDYGMNRYNKSVVPYTVVIEQPELHLHPAMQADFIDACINIIQNNKNSSVKFVIETHSETIINRISESIKKEKLNNELVNINIVNRNEDNQSTIKRVKYDKDGDFLEWPIGFFATESIEYDY